MASGKQLMEQIYDQFLMCKICFEIYKRPKTLVCLHTFCVDCLIKHQDAEFERTYRYSVYNATLSCPICRRKTDLPTGGVRRLPDNFLVVNLADVVTRRRPNAKSQECEICKVDGYNNKRQAVSKCLDCAKHLCRVCVELHMKTKVTKAHSLFDIEIEKEIECKKHRDEIVRFYCEPCEQCICVVCTFQEHKGHDVSSFSEGMQKYQASLDKLVQLCRERITHVKEQIGMITKCEGEIKTAEDQIRDVAIESITDIRKKEREMVQCVYDVFGPEAMEYLKEKQPLQESLETLQNTCNLTDVVTRDKNIELLLLKDEIQLKINKLLERQVEQPPSNLTRQIKFVPGVVDFGQLCVDGEVRVEGNDVNGSLPAIQIKVDHGSVDCQTDSVLLVDQHCGTEASLAAAARQNEHKLTQTSGLITCQEQATNTILVPAVKVRSRGVMTQLSSNSNKGVDQHEKQTATDKTPVSRRKTQTETVPTVEQGVATDNIVVKTSSKGQNTPRLKTREAIIATDRTETCDGETDTLGLVVCESKGVITPLCYLQTATSATMTETVEIRDVTMTSVGSLAAANQSVSVISKLKQSMAGIFTTADAARLDEPNPKRARFDDNSSQTELKLCDLDRLWQMLETKMVTTGSNTNADVVVRVPVEAADASTETERRDDVAKGAAMTENSTTMHSNVFKKFYKGERSLMFSDDVTSSDHVDGNDVRHLFSAAHTGKMPMDDSEVPVCTSEAVAPNDVHLKQITSGDSVCAWSAGPSTTTSRSHATKLQVQLMDNWTSTNHIVFSCDQSSNTVAVTSADKNCGPRAPDMKDKRTSTFIERRNVAIMKRPHCTSRGMLTQAANTHEQTTSTDRKLVTDATSSTDTVAMVTTGCDARKQQMETKCINTLPVATQNSCTATDRVECIQRGVSPIRLPLMTNSECSPMEVPTDSKATMASPVAHDRSVETLPAPSRDSFTMTPTVKHANRKSSPIRDFKSIINQSTGTRHVLYASRALSPVRGLGQTKATMTSCAHCVTRGSSPVRFRGKDKKIMIKPQMTSVDVETTPTPTSDVCVSTLNVTMVDSGMETVKTQLAEKQTLTTKLHSINKMVGTETTRCVDGFTCMATDVASAYKVSITPKPVQTCSRGTRTKAVKCATKETSPHQPFTTDRACSPIKFVETNKQNAPARYQSKEPRDLYQSVGMITMPFRPVADHPKSDLESIEELSEPDDVLNGRGARNLRLLIGRRAVSETDLENRSHHGQGFVYKEDFVSIVPLKKDVQCKETSTPPVEMEDKCVCTESLQLGSDKMAECISKLKTVKQRLEHQPVYVQAPTGSVGKGSMFNSAICQPTATLPGSTAPMSRSENSAIVHSQSEAEAAVVDLLASVGDGNSSMDQHTEPAEPIATTPQIAKVLPDYPKAFCTSEVDTSLRIRSKSIDKLEKETNQRCVNLVSPELSKRINQSSLVQRNSRDDVTKRGVLARVHSNRRDDVMKQRNSRDNVLTPRNGRDDAMKQSNSRDNVLKPSSDRDDVMKPDLLMRARTSGRDDVTKRGLLARAQSSSRDDMMKRGPLARKKRLLMDQLLGRSASLPEQDSVPIPAAVEVQSLTNLSSCSGVAKPSKLSSERILRYLGKPQSSDVNKAAASPQRNGCSSPNIGKTSIKFNSSIRKSDDVITDQSHDVISRSSSSASIASSASTNSTVASIESFSSKSSAADSSSSSRGRIASRSKKGKMMVETAQKEIGQSSDKLFLGFKPSVIKEMKVGRYSAGSRGGLGRSLIKSEKCQTSDK